MEFALVLAAKSSSEDQRSYLTQAWDHLSNLEQTLLLIVLAFVIAWLLARWSARFAGWAVNRYERRHLDRDAADTGVFRGLQRRETAVSLIRTSIRYIVFGLALFYALAQVPGAGKVTTLAGASLVVLLLAFAFQRFLTDILAGTFMFFEGWFSVGDNITVEPWSLEGIVEEVGLRSTRLRAVTGEVIRVNNSAIYATKVRPTGAREVALELYVSDEDAARALIAEIAGIVPKGPTQFVIAPWVEETEVLEHGLVRMRVRLSVAYGREWLAEQFMPDMLKERAPDGLITHGPVAMHLDEGADRRFARSLALSKRR
jgi:moderate conductance mechanosensitive channel